MSNGVYRTIGVHVGMNDNKNWAVLLTDKVYLDFIIPSIKELSDWFGVKAQRNSNKFTTYKKVIEEILTDR